MVCILNTHIAEPKAARQCDTRVRQPTPAVMVFDIHPSLLRQRHRCCARIFELSTRFIAGTWPRPVTTHLINKNEEDP